jgi:hypothetical protein
MPARTSSCLHKNSLPVPPAPTPKRRRGSQSDNTFILKHDFSSSHFRRSDLKDLDNCEFSDLDPKGFDVDAIMTHQGKTLRVLVSKARSDFFKIPKGLVSFFLKKRIMTFLKIQHFHALRCSADMTSALKKHKNHT